MIFFLLLAVARSSSSSYRWQRCVVGGGFFDGTWERSSSGGSSVLCEGHDGYEWRPRDARCALRRGDRGALSLAASRAGVSKFLFMGDSLTGAFKAAFAGILEDDRNDERRKSSSEVKVALRQTYFMVQNDRNAKTSKFRPAEADLDFLVDADVVVANWGAHYGHGNGDPIMFARHLSNYTRRVASRLCASESAPLVVLRSMSLAHPECETATEPRETTRNYLADLAASEAWDHGYNWDKFFGYSALARAFWKVRGLAPIDFNVLNISLSRRDLHYGEERLKDCLHWRTKIKGCTATYRREGEMNYWWVLLLYNLLDAMESEVTTSRRKRAPFFAPCHGAALDDAVVWSQVRRLTADDPAMQS